MQCIVVKVWLNAMHCGKKWWIREFVTPYIFPLNPKYVAARSLRSLRSNKHVVYAVAESRRIRGTELYRQQKTPFMYDGADKWLQFELSMAAMPALISSKIWFFFIALTVVVVVGSPTTDLLESVDCLLRDCVRYFTNADRNNDRFS